MKLEHSFEVEAPLDRVWETMIDVERVAPCLPGAEVTEAADGVYQGTFTVRIGPTTAAYAGKLEMEAVDETAHRVTMRADGRDKRGQGSAKATIHSSMSESGGTTAVEVLTDFTLTGRLARFGRGGMIQDVSNRLLAEFVECIRSSIEQPAGDGAEGAGESTAAAAPPSAKPIHGVRLFFSVLWERIKRLFSS
jgi:carbon monoxide dehydrogenase subunit G